MRAPAKEWKGTFMPIPLCGLSSFRLLRTPPQVKALIPVFPDLEQRVYLDTFKDLPAVYSTTKTPIHVLTANRNRCHCSSALVPHLWSGELPSEAFWEDEELDITYASPLFTLLTMAPSVSVTHLAMAAFELCGAFSIHRPSQNMQPHLDRLSNQRLAWSGNWRQVHDAQGRPTSLWRRDPLIELDALHAFVKKTEGMRGHKKLAQAAQMITGVAYSPLEVQASMRLGAPRTQGGEGFGSFTNNQRINLTRKATRLAGQSTCYADIFFEGSEGHRAIDIECHGHMIHDGGEKGGLDANRTLALQSMGIEVMLLTGEQLYNQQRFNAFADYLARTLGIRRRPKTAAMQRKEHELCGDLFIDWETLGESSKICKKRC